jgi:hypothetical protein
MNRQAVLPAILVIAVFVGTTIAQNSAKPAAKNDEGFTSYVEFGGTSNSAGQVYELNSSVGYNFSRHFGMDVGIPLEFVRASTSTGPISNNGIGNPYADLHLKFLSPVINFGSTLTGFAPVADSKKGLSTGRGTFDWTNHFDHSFSSLTPFVEVGIANTIPDSRLFMRPYTTLGFNSHFQGGANLDIWKFFSVGASAYDILPSGQQTVFSRVAGQQAGTMSHNRVFQGNQQTTGTSDIAKDNGYSAWIGANPNKYMDLQLGYTRSVHYALNSVSFSVGFNLGALARRGPQQ